MKKKNKKKEQQEVAKEYQKGKDYFKQVEEFDNKEK